MCGVFVFILFCFPLLVVSQVVVVVDDDDVVVECLF